MTRPLAILGLAALLTGGSVVADAAPAARSTTAKPTRAARRHAAKTAVQAPPAPTMPRTLQDVHIEGEVPVPQVLFITARDQRRFMDFQHHRYLKNSAELGEATPFPTWVAVIHGSPTIPGKEPSR